MTTNWTAMSEAKMAFKELKEKFAGQLDPELDGTFKTISINDPEIPDDAVVYIDGFGFGVSFVKEDGEGRKIKKSYGGTIKRQ